MQKIVNTLCNDGDDDDAKMNKNEQKWYLFLLLTTLKTMKVNFVKKLNKL